MGLSAASAYSRPPSRFSYSDADLSLIVAAAVNRVPLAATTRSLGGCRGDLKRFKSESPWANPSSWGARHYESIGRPLPGRANIVMTRDPEFFR